MRKELTTDAAIKQILDDLQELKLTQFLGGDSWLFYRNHSDAATDLHVSMPVANSVKVYRIAFVPDDPSILCAAQLFLAENWNFGFREQLIPVQGADFSWDLRLSENEANFVYDMKVQIKSTQQGTFTVSQIA